jgi:hypothetical protein
VEVVRTDERYCFFWIPMCVVNRGSPYGACTRCGSRMPASAVRAQRAAAAALPFGGGGGAYPVAQPVGGGAYHRGHPQTLQPASAQGGGGGYVPVYNPT